MSQIYIHNSTHKDFIRNKWIEFATEIYSSKHEEFGIITFPAAEMQDLKLFAENGLIEWEPNETESFKIKKGKVICFEKSTKIFAVLQSKLVNAKVEPKEIGAFLRENYNKFMSGNNVQYFPVHVINLDYDGNISKSKIRIDEIISLIFNYQKIHKRSFSFFVTWPCTEEEDEDEYKKLLKQIVTGNVDGHEGFRMQFMETYKSVDDLHYDNLSVIGLSKIIIKAGCQNLFELNKNEFYIYGESGRRKMYSVLFNLKYTENVGREQILYQENVMKSLESIKTLEKRTA